MAVAMLNLRSLSTIGLLVLTVGCGGSTPPPDPAPMLLASAPSPAPVEVTKSPADAKPPEAPKPEKKPPATAVFRITEGIATPESVLYDEVNDRYLVSNINGKPDQADNNGYISEISPDGKVVKAKFIAGGVAKVKLDAPKGTGIVDGVLYVADITVVRKFDLKTGAPKGDIAVPGATFLNDIAVAKDGRIFVSDSGMKPGAAGFEPTGTDAVYVIEKGKLRTVAKAKDLNGPNGLLVVDKGVLVAPFSSNELYRLDEKGTKQDATKLPGGGLDGIVQADDSLFISSWESSTVYRGTLGGAFQPAFADLKSPADIGFDSKRKRLLVPRFLENAVEVYELR